jgi:integrase
VIKSTKSGKVRHVPLDDALRNKLLALVKKNPWGNSYVFYGNTKESPLAGSAVAGGFLRALALYGMTPEERKERRISFHSWRSFANSELGKTLDPAKLRAVIGHTSERLTDMYTSITTEDSGKIIDFQERFLRGVR